MIDKETKFRPVIGTEEAISNIDSNTPGYLYFASDTGKMFLDISTDKRISVGGDSGGGAAVLYSTVSNVIQDEDDHYYHIEADTITDTTAHIAVDDLIIASDGAFYKVALILNSTLYCSRIAVSGNGSSSEDDTPTYKKKISATVTNVAGTSSLINGQDAYAQITVNSAIDSDETILDEKGQLWVDITLQLVTTEGTKQQYTTYYTTTVYDLDDGQSFTFNFGKYARESAKSRLIITPHGANSGDGLDISMGNFSMGALSLTLTESFSSKITEAFKPSELNISCNALGNMERIVDFSWDGEIVNSQILQASDTGRDITFSVYNDKDITISHGYHTVKIELSQYVNSERKISTDPIEFEVGVNAGETDAIVWLGDYKTAYYNYDDIEIPYYVFDPEPENSVVTVKLLKNNIEDGSREFTNISAGSTVSSSFEITDFDEEIVNFYTISCIKGTNGVDSVSRDIYFSIIDDSSRDMHIQEQLYLDASFTAKGRSNDESTISRQTWTDGNIVGKFENFNWYNNGWIKTDDGTALRISNGAKFSVPIGKTIFSGTGLTNQSHTFEFQFKIRNVQSYENLISNITRYSNDSQYYKKFYGYKTYTAVSSGDVYDASSTYFIADPDNEGEYISAGIIDAAGYTAATEQLYIGSNEGYLTSYTNYDAFLQNYATLHDLDYDKITENYDYTQKIFNLSAVACGYYSGNIKAPIGFGLGPQDAFFSNGTNTVNASYVEDKMVNLTITYDSTDKLMSIYVNGVLTGVIYSTLTGSFTIDSTNLVFSSEYCDIDLYKFRVYHTPLTINQVVTNYAVDLKDVTIYDQNTLVNANDKTKFDFQEMLDYNTAHPDDPIMPYIIFDTTNSNNSDRLSWSKKTDVTISVEFVNTVLDRAYTSGELDELAAAAGQTVEDYYQHHCPSWKGDNISMKVQGTSSEYYPRRNYKLKTKDSNKVIHMTMHKGPFASNNTDTKWFYMDNDSVGTNKFTMKIDFMESSGSYNRGLANLLNNAYSHHPLYYYNEVGAFTKETTEGVIVEGEYTTETYDENATYYYYSNKGKLKIADGSESDGLKITSAEDFALGPKGLATATGVEKVLGLGTNATNLLSYAYGSDGNLTQEKAEAYENKWFVGQTVYKNLDIESLVDLDDLRTTVQGFPVLAFHKKSDGTYTYIGRYNMLTDKGSDETYGFKISDAYLKWLDNKDVEEAAEGWEFENNTRGFCSFRDPLNRRFLSFNIDPTDNALNSDFSSTVTTSGYLDTETNQCPSVVSDFEYRYNATADALDLIAPVDGTSTRIEALTADNKKTIKKVTGVQIDTVEQGQNLIYDIYGNWEKAVAWVWSTCLDASFVKKQSEIDLLSDEEKEEYLLKKYNKVDSTASYDSNVKYYKYYRHLYVDYTYNADTWADDLAAGLYTLDVYTQSYGNVTYTYDSYEYRWDKFKNELDEHFNVDYLATYFVVTEALELYDSRGKNAMFVSWGPMSATGEYIWFPIFYDMDTQLGINNTGIPSFTFSIDATEDGTFSTNDSVLWNNFYKIFKGQITQKYCQLKGQTSGTGDFTPLTYGPFATVDRIEAWYESDPDECGSITMRGQRPLSAINLDEYYKYIAITSTAGGGYLGQSGNTIFDNSSTSSGDGDPKGSYFYALQGDRSLSRIQFLKNRFNYLDSWLGVGIYSKSGGQDNSFWGRSAANYLTELDGVDTSDKWVENSSYPDNYSKYWVNDIEGGEKVNEFDSEYWLTLTPARKSYLNAIVDDDSYQEKYIDTPVTMYLRKTENGVKTSPNYKEQLIYIYGTEVMKNFGNLYNLYLTELHTVDANNLTDLILGWDGLDKNGKSWYNHGTNSYTLSAMPLLKEANMSNITYKSGASSYVLDFSKSEKLENFRATGSNFTQIKFAAGVALNTCYLPTTLTTLELTEARQLKNIVTNYKYPELNTSTGKYEITAGLFIEGLTNKLDDPSQISTSLTQISIINAYNLGYDSYKLLNGYYQYRKADNSTVSKIAMTEVDWTPYKKIEEQINYNSEKEYYLIDNHYGLVKYEYDPTLDIVKDSYGNITREGGEWSDHITNGELYYLDNSVDGTIIKDIEMFDVFMNKSTFRGTADSEDIPNITGTIYIDNDETLYTTTGVEVDEYYVRNVLQVKYPKITFFFKTIKKMYTARFILTDDDNQALYTTIGTQTIKDGEWFINPMIAYGDISESKANYDFYGWSKTDGDTENVLCSQDDTTGTWDSQSLTAEVYDYVFYAVFKIHSYVMTFIDGDGNTYIKKMPYSGTTQITAPDKTDFIPSKDDSGLIGEKAEYTYRFKGWSRSENGAIITLSKYTPVQDYTFYAIFDEVSVYDNVLDDSYFTFKDLTAQDKTALNYGRTETEKQSIDYTEEKNYTNLVSMMLNPKMPLSGKITLPLKTSEGKYVAIIKNGTTSNPGGFSGNENITHIFFDKNVTDPKLMVIGPSAFSEMPKLQEFEYISSLRYIQNNAFETTSGTGSLDVPDFSNCSKLTVLGSSVYSTDTLAYSPSNKKLFIPGSVVEVGNNFMGICYTLYDDLELQFGDENNPTSLQLTNIGNNGFYPQMYIGTPIKNTGFSKIIVYYNASSNTKLADKTEVFNSGKFSFPDSGWTFESYPITIQS